MASPTLPPIFRSHPAWVCGLKLYNCHHIYLGLLVTPCVGVWIETKSNDTYKFFKWVTPCVGVWIETCNWFLACTFFIVTPCVGVWIETCRHTSPALPWSVTPCVGVWIETNKVLCLGVTSNVTPCVGVWIETFLGSSASSTSCHTLRGCVDWNGKQLNQHLILHCHTLRGCVDWNILICKSKHW